MKFPSGADALVVFTRRFTVIAFLIVLLWFVCVVAFTGALFFFALLCMCITDWCRERFGDSQSWF